MSAIKISEDNPFQKLIAEANHDPAQLQSRYESHRETRNEQQRTAILRPEFAGWKLDEILMRLDGPRKEEGYLDPRNCLVIWARPSPAIRDLIAFVQGELKSVAPSLWTMPDDCLHTTVLEVAHSLTEGEIENLVQTLQSSEVSTRQISEYAVAHQTRLLKPLISFDSAALALTLVPAAGEGVEASPSGDSDSYSYHHLRRDIFDITRQANLPVASRYIVPSAHITIGRFITDDGFVKGDDGRQVDSAAVKRFVDKIGEVNDNLKRKYWPSEGGIPDGGEWIVGQEMGLVVRRGRLWYGGGEDVPLG
ncbi:hypothetical protein N7532_001180 [Penicillium argentinense]|uniref:RNA ligase/cyclic nucleotide phosphodiesterase n=1 Tax=Penicillium argentinense TaxID=1131581 RepID=A0A9W9G2W2_9EURO|nr:uncharacterized protein N7532_001180 [Penicillium argentinense]KAJ5110645.1 hypothetical protein N7532_001180 [Penicillium argentinense]